MPDELCWPVPSTWGHTRPLPMVGSSPSPLHSGQIRLSQLGKYPGLAILILRARPRAKRWAGTLVSLPLPSVSPFADIFSAALADMVVAAVKQGEPCCHTFKRGLGLLRGTHKQTPAEDSSSRRPQSQECGSAPCARATLHSRSTIARRRCPSGDRTHLNIHMNIHEWLE